MPTYNSRIVREQGGSVMALASGASLNLAAGAPIGASGGLILSGGSAQVGTTASLLVKPTATAGGQPYAILNIGPNQMWYAPGSAGSPTFSGSPGDFLWIANSASTSFWANVSIGTAGSNWRAVALLAGSQFVAGQ